MANPNPPKEWQFKPGRSGNPGGRPKDLLTSDQVSAIIGRLTRLNYDALKSLAKEPKSTTPMIEVIVASILVEAADKGDYSRLESLLTRAIGKVKDISEVHQHNYDSDLDQEPRENVIELLRQMRGPKLNGTD